MQVEIFKTNVQHNEDAIAIISCLQLHFPAYGFNFDLDDCDRILRIETQNGKINKQQIIQLLGSKGYTCTHLI